MAQDHGTLGRHQPFRCQNDARVTRHQIGRARSPRAEGELVARGLTERGYPSHDPARIPLATGSHPTCDLSCRGLRQRSVAASVVLFDEQLGEIGDVGAHINGRLGVDHQVDLPLPRDAGHRGPQLLVEIGQ